MHGTDPWLNIDHATEGSDRQYQPPYFEPQPPYKKSPYSPPRTATGTGHMIPGPTKYYVENMHKLS